MKLKRLSVQNLRSFMERQDLSLDEDITILIGPNGGGKTNRVRHHTLKNPRRPRAGANEIGAGSLSSKP